MCACPGVISKQPPLASREAGVEPFGAAWGLQHLPCSLFLGEAILHRVQGLHASEEGGAVEVPIGQGYVPPAGHHLVGQGRLEGRM